MRGRAVAALGLLAMGDVARAEAPPVAAADDAPVAVARLPWPWRLLPDARHDVVCTVDATLDQRGRPTAPQVVACPEAVRELALRKVRGWRFPPDAGASRRVVLRWRAPADVTPPPMPQRWMWRETMHCAAQVVVDVDGEVGAMAARRVSDGCGVALSPLGTPPRVAGGVGRTPAICPVTFIADEHGVADVVEVFRCAPSTWARARDVVRAASWRAPEAGAWAWSVVLQLDVP